MELTKDTTVGNVVTQNIKSAHVFKKFGIDFCCGGGVSMEKACEKNGVNYDELAKELQSVEKSLDKAFDYDSLPLDQLIDRILSEHHTYVAENIPLMLQYSNKVKSVHGDHAPELIEINKIVTDVANELSSHMQKEEQILFPFIKEMVRLKNANLPLGQPHFGTVNNPIAMMESEHENAGDAFKRIAELTNNYTPPEWACNTFKALYSKLEEFEQDLHQHVHLENNILHPKATALERSL